MGLMHIKECGIKSDTPTKKTMLSVMFCDIQENCSILCALLCSIYFNMQNIFYVK